MHSATRSSSRRTFIKGSLIGAAGLIVPRSTWARPIGANDDIRIGFIGIGEKAGGRGSNHLSEFPKKKGCRVAAVCDADQAVIDIVKAKLDGQQVSYQQDYRKVLEDPNIDAVVIATPNHLHALIAIQAILAGKHVYVEKPVSHNIWEGRMLANYAAKHPELVVQHGMQRRSDEGWLEIKEYVKSGKIGKPLVSRGFCYKRRKTIGQIGTPGKAPSTVDYSLWSGPREMEPVHRKRFHYDWHWQWQWGNGDIGNQGPHQTDVARWLIDDPEELPTSVISIGGRFGYDDDATTANTQIAFYDYKPVPVIFEVRGLARSDSDDREPNFEKLNGAPIRVGNVLECEGGWVAEGQILDKEGKKITSIKKDDGANHQQTFLNAIRAGKQELRHKVITGHHAAALAHLANTSYRLGKNVPHGEAAERIKGDANHADAFGRMLEHLKSNKVDIDKTPVVLGAPLAFNPKTEKYEGALADEANKLNAETYRKEFSIEPVSA